MDVLSDARESAGLAMPVNEPEIGGVKHVLVVDDDASVLTGVYMGADGISHLRGTRPARGARRREHDRDVGSRHYRLPHGVDDRRGARRTYQAGPPA